VDSMARTPLDADIFKKGAGKKIIAITESAPQKKVEVLSKKAEIIVSGKKTVNLENLLAELKTRGIHRLMVEGGAMLNWGLISRGLVDEIYTFIGNIIIGGISAPTFVDGDGFVNKFCRLSLISCEKLEDGVLLRWKVQHD
jgi:2,5-diamino-6-(ribosylamino)-4(3H)-pyrimidinone 5'-phosphate reductase